MYKNSVYEMKCTELTNFGQEMCEDEEWTSNEVFLYKNHFKPLSI